MTTATAHITGTWLEPIWPTAVCEDYTREEAAESAMVVARKAEEPVINLAGSAWWRSYVQSRLMQFASR